GRIEVNSEGSDCGSNFSVVLPMVAAPVAGTSTGAPSTARTGPSRHILIVDDNVPSAQTTGWMLELLGHRCTLAHNGATAIDLALELKPDAILLDIGLPDISGYDVCRALRAEAQFVDTLIIAQTGWGQQRDRDLAHQAGFSHHLVKPLRLEQLSDLLAQSS